MPRLSTVNSKTSFCLPKKILSANFSWRIHSLQVVHFDASLTIADLPMSSMSKTPTGHNFFNSRASAPFILSP